MTPFSQVMEAPKVDSRNTLKKTLTQAARLPVNSCLPGARRPLFATVGNQGGFSMTQNLEDPWLPPRVAKRLEALRVLDGNPVPNHIWQGCSA